MSDFSVIDDPIVFQVPEDEIVFSLVDDTLEVTLNDYSGGGGSGPGTQDNYFGMYFPGGW